VLASTPQLERPELVFDVASVSCRSSDSARELAHFVASHPAGRTGDGGVRGRRRGVFDGRTWAIAPGARYGCSNPARGARHGARSPAAGYRGRGATTGSWRSARIFRNCSRVCARSATGRSPVISDERVYDLCGPGMASMLRLAHSDAALWAPIAQANATAVAEAFGGGSRRLASDRSRTPAGQSRCVRCEHSRALTGRSMLWNVQPPVPRYLPYAVTEGVNMLKFPSRLLVCAAIVAMPVATKRADRDRNHLHAAQIAGRGRDVGGVSEQLTATVRLPCRYSSRKTRLGHRQQSVKVRPASRTDNPAALELQKRRSTKRLMRNRRTPGRCVLLLRSVFGAEPRGELGDAEWFGNPAGD